MTPFQAGLRDPEQPVPPDLSVTARAHLEDRYAIYRNNFVVGTVDALADTFPIIHTLLGETFFRGMARDYVRENPPKSAVILGYGEDFPDYLDRLDLLADYPYLGDVARLEWARITAFNAADADPLDPAVLISLPPESMAVLRVEMHPSFHLIQSDWPIVSIWQANNSEDPSMLEEGLPDHGEDALVCRNGMDVDIRFLPPGGLTFLTALHAGRPLGEAAEAALAVTDEFDLAVNLQGLIESGAIIGVQTEVPD